MTVDESLSDRVFEEKKSHRLKINSKLQGRFVAADLPHAIKETLAVRGFCTQRQCRDNCTSLYIDRFRPVDPAI
jgi:hypothetical protein